jgi:hypothetical protein
VHTKEEASSGLSPSDLHWAALELFDAYAGKGERVFKSISAVEDVR